MGFTFRELERWSPTRRIDAGLNRAGSETGAPFVCGQDGQRAQCLQAPQRVGGLGVVSQAAPARGAKQDVKAVLEFSLAGRFEALREQRKRLWVAPLNK